MFILVNNPSVSEDGILIDTSVLEKFKIPTYQPRSVEFGQERYPLNLYQK